MTKQRFFLVFLTPAFIAALALFLIFSQALAQEQSTPSDGLVPIGCQKGCPCTLCDFYELGKNVTRFLLYGLSIPIAALAFLYGGFMLLTSGGNRDKLVRGKSAMTNAVIGLALAFFSWAILNVILGSVSFGIGFGGNVSNWYDPPSCESGGGDKCFADLPPVEGPGGKPGPIEGPGCGDGACTPPESADPAAADYCPIDCGGPASDGGVRSELEDAGIKINKTCIDPTKKLSQTCLDNLGRDAIDGLKKAREQCNCIRVTGGTEQGHLSHGPGIPTVDIAYNPDAVDALRNTGVLIDAGFGLGATCEDRKGKTLPCAGPGPIDHIHVEF